MQHNLKLLAVGAILLCLTLITPWQGLAQEETPPPTSETPPPPTEVTPEAPPNTPVPTDTPPVEVLPPTAIPAITVPTYLLNDTVEMETSLWTGTWGRAAELPHSGGWVWSDSPGFPYAAGTENALTLVQPLGIPLQARTQLRYWQYVDLAGSDSVRVELSTDQVNWQTLRQEMGVRNLAWTFEAVDLSPWTGQAVWLRFVLSAAPAPEQTHQGWWLDDLEVLAEPIPVPTLSWLEEPDSENPLNWWLEGNWQPNGEVQVGAQSWMSPSLGQTQTALTLRTDINLNGIANPELRFWQKLNLLGGDTAQAELSTDGGQTWQVLALYNEAVNTEAWSLQQVSLAAYNQQLVRVRFVLTIGDPLQPHGWGWWVDGITINTAIVVPPTATTTPTPVLSPTPSATPDPWTQLSDHDSRLVYGNGVWQGAAVAGAVGGDLTYTTTPYADMTLSFVGTDLELLYATGPEGGQAYLQLINEHGETVATQTLSSWSENYGYQQTLSFTGLPAAAYTLNLINVSGAVWIEGIRLLETPAMGGFQPFSEGGDAPNASGTCEETIPAEDTLALINALVLAQSCAETTIHLTNDGGTVYYLTEVNNTSLGATGLPLIQTHVTIHGNGATVLRDWDSPNFRFFGVANTGHLSLYDLNMESGYSDQGGAFYVAGGALTLYGTTLQVHTSGENGGVIFAEANSSVVAFNNRFWSNYANGLGGVLYFEGDDSEITFHSNWFGSNSTDYLPGSAVFLNGVNVAGDWEFRDNCFMENSGLSVAANSPLDAQGNWWNDPNGPNQGGDQIHANVNGGTFLTERPLHCTDSDEDGIYDDEDNCVTVYNQDQFDSDEDGTGDACEDTDGDGFVDTQDNCPLVTNEDQFDSDTDGIGDVCQDTDGDGVLDTQDNCPLVANENQFDSDTDGIGDACEDADEDGVADPQDNCPFQPNSDQLDVDPNNSVGDVCELADDDQDGLTNQAEAALGTNRYNRDTDGDRAPDQAEVDNNGFPTTFDNSLCNANLPTGDTQGLVDALLRFRQYSCLEGIIDLAEFGEYALNSVFADPVDQNHVNGLPTITGKVTIHGHGATLYREETGVGLRFFTVASMGDLTLENTIFLNGLGGAGGVIQNAGGTLHLIGNVFRLNAASDGGVLDLTEGSVTVAQANVFEANQASLGGAVFIRNLTTQVNFTDNLFRQNTVSDRGAAVFIHSDATDTVGAWQFVDNCFVGNAPVSFDTLAGAGVIAQGNWWNNSAGPSVGGIGSGDEVAGGVDYSNFYTSVPTHCADPDVDLDDIGESTDNCPFKANPAQIDENNDGIGDACQGDIDGDGYIGTADNCPFVANPDQTNSDPDSLGDACDPDDDNDGVEDGSDNCVLGENPNQGDDDLDGVGNVCEDDDGDEWANYTDNCPLVANPDQLNTDGEGEGDVCDPDDDNDGFDDGSDNCPLNHNPDQLNTDLDAEGNVCDPNDDVDSYLDSVDNCPVHDNEDQEDWNTNGVGDVCEDTDGDSLTDAEELANGTNPNDAHDPELCIIDVPDGDVAALISAIDTLNSRDALCPNGLINLAEDGFYGITASHHGADRDLAAFPQIVSTITIAGHNATLDNQVGFGLRFFEVPYQGSLTLQSLMLVGGDSRIGAAVFVEGQLTVRDSTFRDNQAQDAGAIFVDIWGALTVERSIFEENYADWNGGAIGINGAATIQESAFFYNRANSGSAIFSYPNGGTTFIQNAFLGNSGFSVVNENPAENVQAINNWWGSNSGPSDVSDSWVDSVGAGVDYEPFLEAVPAQYAHFDWDEDGFNLAQESAAGTDPQNPDTDDDGTNDGADNCPIDSNENQENADSDLLGDACDTDDDDDGVEDSADNCPLIPNGNQADDDEDGLGDPCDDSDGDGLTDFAEFEIHETDPFDSDTDDDGLTDGDEVDIYETEPLDEDTDNDGVWDGDEVANGWNPKDINDPYSCTVTLIDNQIAPFISAIEGFNAADCATAILNLAPNVTYEFTTAYAGENALPLITVPLQINGNGATLQRLTTAENFRFFEGYFLEMNNLTLAGGRVTEDGGAIYSSTHLTLDQVTLTGNTADFGGAIFVGQYGYATLTNVQLQDNLATMGGAIYQAGGHINLLGVELVDNHAESGGAIFVANGYLNVSLGSVLLNNTAETCAALDNRGQAVISETNFEDNISTTGAAICEQPDAEGLTANHSCFTGNSPVSVINADPTVGTLTPVLYQEQTAIATDIGLRRDRDGWAVALGQAFTIPTNETILRIEVALKKTTNVALGGTLVVTLHNNNAGVPGSVIQSGTPINASELTTSYQWFASEFNINLNAGTVYQLVVSAQDTLTGDTDADFSVWGADSSGSAYPYDTNWKHYTSGWQDWWWTNHFNATYKLYAGQPAPDTGSLDFRYNWWGSATGAFGSGEGLGEPIGAGVNASNHKTTAPATCDADTDGDSLSDRQEGDYGTDEALADTDGDGLGDGEEVRRHETDPLLPDTDGDTLSDGAEIQIGSDPLSVDTDGDTLIDGVDNCPVIANPNQDNQDEDAFGDVCDADLDGDGIIYAPQVDGLGTGLNARYYEGRSFETLVFSQLDSRVDFNWGWGGVTPTLSDNFSVQWGGFLEPRYSETYTFCTLSDDGARMWVGDSLVVSNYWGNYTISERCGSIWLEAGRLYPIGVEYNEWIYAAEMYLYWSSSSQIREVIPTSQLYPSAFGFDGDNCPLVSNINQVDFDTDGIGDVCDTDIDGDGDLNEADNCSLASNADQADQDSDQIGDVCDEDADDDGDLNEADNCPLAPNEDQLNTDGEGEGDVCDLDDDNDGAVDTADNCPLVSSPNQDDLDTDGIGDVCDADQDGDGDLNEADNCPLIPNEDQLNTDGEGAGDVCDEDDDNDTVLDETDNCPLMPNTDQANADGDADGDVCEPGAPDLRPEGIGQSQVVVSPAPVAANNEAYYEVRVIIKDETGRAINFVPISVSVDQPSATLTPATGETDDNGEWVTWVRSSAATTATIEIMVDGVGFTSKILEFVQADPSVTLSGTPASYANGYGIYRVQVQNAVMAAQDLTLTVGLPFGKLSFVSETHPSTASLTAQTPTSATWVIPALAVGESQDFFLVARLGSNLSLREELSIQATLAAAQDANGTNNTASTITTVIPIPTRPATEAQSDRLSLSYTALTSSTVVGEVAQLQVTLQNTSTEPLYNVRAYADLAEVYGTLPLVWENTSGVLLPNQSVVATFSVPITPDFPNLTTQSILAWGAADDANPSDGQPAVSVSDRLTDAELQVNGPGLSLTVNPNVPTVNAGEEVTFTVTVQNHANRNDAATITSLVEQLTGVTLNLTPNAALQPGESATATFNYTPQAVDVPTLTVPVRLEGQGVTYPAALTSLLATTQVSVYPLDAPTPNSPDLMVSITPLLGAIPNQPITPQLTLTNMGVDAAQTVTLTLYLPEGVSADEVGAGVYNPTQQQVIWTYPSVAGGETLTIPTELFVGQNWQVGTQLPLSVVARSQTVEGNYTNNSVQVHVPVMAATPSALSQFRTLTRDWLVADGVDEIEVQVTARDILGNPLANQAVTVEAGANGVTLTPLSDVTDAEGNLLVKVTATQPGAVTLYATFANGEPPLELILDRQASLLALSENNISVGVGGQTEVEVLLRNLSGSGERFSFALTGLPPAWYSFDPTEVVLGAGGLDESALTLVIPSTSCTVAGEYPFVVQAFGETTQITGEAAATLQVTAAPPTLTDFYPVSGATLGDTQVNFRWVVNTPGVATVFVRPQGSTEYTAYPLTAVPNTAQWTAPVDLALGQYEWYGTMETDCGISKIASAAAPLPFSIVNGVRFVDRSYSYTLRDDYNQSVDSAGNPLLAWVENLANANQPVMVMVENPYPDLIVGFMGSGSIEQATVLQPHQMRSFNLRVFTQDITQLQYDLHLRLVSGDITDSIPLTLHITPPTFAVSYGAITIDPLTRTHSLSVTNTGDTVTDFQLRLLDAEGLPANVIINPDLTHVYFPEGETLTFDIIPLELNETGTPLEAYTVENCAGEACLPPAAFAYDPTCGENTQVEESIEDLEIHLVSNSWYCTNRPNIDVVMQLPYLGYGANVFEATASASFAAGDIGPVYNHLTELGFNGVGLEYGIVPQTATLTATIPSNMIDLNGGAHVINLRSTHNAFGDNNNAHYVVGSDFRLDLIVQNMTRETCQPDVTPPPPPPPAPYCPIILPTQLGGN